MAFDKAIESGKERRKQYHGSKAVDKTCRNHGSCDYCRDNRMIAIKKEEDDARSRKKDFETGEI